MPGSVKRLAAGVISAAGAANGVFMLAAPTLWYDSVPGLAHAGPFNAHFVADIGVAYLASSLGLIARAWRPRYWPAAVAGAAFMIGHAVIHVLDIAFARAGNPSVDALLVIAPAAAALWAAAPDKME